MPYEAMLAADRGSAAVLPASGRSIARPTGQVVDVDAGDEVAPLGATEPVDRGRSVEHVAGHPGAAWSVRRRGRRRRGPRRS